MDRYSKSSEGIHQGSKIARNSFGSPSSSSSSAAAAHPSSASKINHSTQTTNEHVRLNNNITTTTTTNPSSNINKSHHQVYKEGTGTSGDHLRDELSMATKDTAVQQQLQKSQFYQRGLHDPLTTQSSNSNCSSSATRGRGTRGLLSKMESEDDDAAAVATDEDEDIDRKLDPYMYDNVQYS
ncbi:hypothetical protein BGZ97_004816 [Linnemannia gamsii]|uniref:Uncharacterized protein n=1 Tax=Linnemannia gamsii TaxID=64522 RepID=A0A9P6UGS2_9FUNG|nr:hypothetical protein BGZ97_004816 [Linnemannia gamsii]